MPALQVTLFGRFQFHIDGNDVTPSLQSNTSGLALLAYLAVEGQAQPRARLAALLWPEKSDADARNSLRQTLHKLKTSVGPDVLVTTRQTVGLSDATSDLTAVRQALSEFEISNDPESLTPLVTHYQSLLLNPPPSWDSIPFVEWLMLTREGMHRRVMDAYDLLIAHHMSQARWTDAQRAAQQQLALDGWREQTHRQLMEIFRQQGKYAQAYAQYDSCCTILMQELGVEPSQDTKRLYEQLKQAESSAVVTTDDAIAVVPSRLPTPATPFIGRVRELAQIKSQCQDKNCRLLSLVGQGGMGKTRLAIELGRQLRDEFEHGVFWVPLEGIDRSGSQRTQLLTAVAEAVDLTVASSSPLDEQLIEFFRNREILLLLDNCEQLVGDLPLITKWLSAAPKLKLVTTTRVALRLQEEWTIGVGGMNFPATGDSAEKSDATDAVRLFFQRARMVKPDYPLSVVEVPSAARICQLVEGMPLAIELAAGWLEVLTPPEIVQEIWRGLEILTSTERNRPGRHRSIATVLESTWQQLSADVQQSMSMLSVFRGGFTRAAAAAVADTSFITLKLLGDRALVRFRAESGRYDVHRLVRQFAADKLAEPRAVSRKHANYFADWMGDNVGGFSAELDNLQTAWQWAAKHDAALTDRYIEPLFTFYDAENLTTETIDLLSEALNSPLATQVDAAKRASWRRRLGEGHFRIGAMTKCRDLHLATLDELGMPMPGNRVSTGLAMSKQMAQQLIHRRRLPEPTRDNHTARLEAVRILERLGQIYFFEKDSLTAGYTALKGLNIAETMPPSAELGRLYANTCLAVGIMPQHKLASTYQEAALTTIRHVDDPAATAWALEVLSIYNSGLANWDKVTAWIDEALVNADLVNDQRRRDECMVMHATTARYTGELDRCFSIWQAMHEAATKRGDQQVATWGLGGMLDMYARMGEIADRHELFEASLQTKTMRDQNDNVSMQSAHGLQAIAGLHLDDLPTTLAAVRQGVALMTKTTPTSYSDLDSYEDLAESCLLLYNRDPKRFKATLDLVAQANVAFRKFAAIFPIGQPGHALCEGWELWINGKQRSAVTRWDEGIALAQQLDMPIEEAKLHAIKGNLLGDSAEIHRQKANRLFDASNALGEKFLWMDRFVAA